MPGASKETQRVTHINANYTTAAAGEDGTFELLVVTEGGQRYTFAPSAAAMSGLVALTQASNVLLWDPQGQTLIAVNVVGSWLPETWSGED